jgi:ubiquinone/menaquinone biosynthesis C-methylase UbiE
MTGMLPLLGTVQRKIWVNAQFGTGQQAQAYADAHALSSSDSVHRASRILLLHELLAKVPKGRLLDAGCGPGVLVRSLLDAPAFDYEITALDQSEAMIRYCVSHTGSGSVRALVGDLEHLPFGDASFDVTVVTGVLEYINARVAVRQLSRVTRPGGAVVISMLNPMSPYWLTDWFLYQPTLRLLFWAAKTLRVRTKRPHAADRSGIRALPSRVLRRYLRQSGLIPANVVYFDPMPLVPPLDRISALRHWPKRRGQQLQTAKDLRRWMAMGYVVVAYRR